LFDIVSGIVIYLLMCCFAGSTSLSFRPPSGLGPAVGPLIL
jgi:hypothetical protein